MEDRRLCNGELLKSQTKIGDRLCIDQAGLQEFFCYGIMSNREH